MDQSPHRRFRSSRALAYQNVVLTAIAGLLALHLMDRTSGAGSSGAGLVAQVLSPAAASAQASMDSEPGGLANAIQQRKEMIGELRLIGSRLDRIDSKLNSGINVKVTDMPALKLPPELRLGGTTRPDKPEPKSGKTTVTPSTTGAPEPR